MGNQYNLAMVNAKDHHELYLEDLGVSPEGILHLGRLFKSVKCWSDEGYYIHVKVYIKDTTNVKMNDKRTSEMVVVNQVKKKLLMFNKALSLKIQPNVLPYFRMLETEKAAYLVRQFCCINLSERLSTRPFLNNMSKMWVTYQILNGLTQLHTGGELYHGDLKGQNVVMTGWDWVFITDLAPFKPLTLSLTNTQSVYAFFFNTSKQGKTTLAPERIADKINMSERAFTNKMDVFSAGCILLQLYLDGVELFDFSQLLEYKSGKKSRIDSVLKEVRNKEIRNIIKEMLNLNNEKRIGSSECLKKAQTIFPPYFEVLHRFFAKLLLKSIDERISIIYDLYDEVVEYMESNGKILMNNLHSFLRIGKYKKIEDEEIDEYIDGENLEKEKKEKFRKSLIVKKKSGKKEDEIIKLINETQKLKKFVSAESVKIKDKNSKFPIKIKPREKLGSKKNQKKNEVNFKVLKNLRAKEGIDFIASLVCSCIRNGKSTEIMLKGFEIVRKMSYHCTDYTRFQRIVPYICSLLPDKPPVIKVAAIETLSHALLTIESFSQEEVNLFPDYIIPTLKPLVYDESDIVRVSLSKTILRFAEASKRFLELEQDFRRRSIKSEKSSLVKGDYDDKLGSIRTDFIGIVQELTKDPCLYVKIELLKSLPHFCDFCGSRRATQEIIPIIITFLNSSSWRLRSSFFKNIAHIGKHIGITAVKSYVLPCVFQSLFDSEEYVVDSVLHSIVMLCRFKLLSRENLFDLSKKIAPLLYHPNNWIRYDAVEFFVETSKEIGLVDSYCFLLPELEDYFSCKIHKLNVYSMLEALKPPLNRFVFDMSIKRLLKLEKNRKSILHWSDLLKRDLTEDEVDKLEKMKEFIFKTGTTLRRKTLKAQTFSGLEEYGLKEREPKDVKTSLKILSNNYFSLSEFDFLRKTVSIDIKGKNKYDENIAKANIAFLSSRGGDNEGGFKPRGDLYCQSKEHKESITSLCYYEKGGCLISGSKDNTIKIWDVNDININKSFSLDSSVTHKIKKEGGFITSTTCFPSDPIISYSTSKGFIEIYNIPKNKVLNTILIDEFNTQFVNQIDTSYVTNKNSEYQLSVNVLKPYKIFNSTIIIAGTQNGKVHALDRRSKAEIFELTTSKSLKYGPITAMCGNDVWIVTGTRRGFLTLWDLRFQMPLSVWRISSDCINDLTIRSQVGSLINIGSGSGGKKGKKKKNYSPTILVANSSRDIFEYDIGTDKTVKLYRCSDPNENKSNFSEVNYMKNALTIFKANSTVSNSNISKAKKAYEKIKETKKKEKVEVMDVKPIEKNLHDPFATKELDSISWNNHKTKYDTKSIYVNEDGSFFSGGSDRKIRFWNPQIGRTKESYIISGLKPNERAIYKNYEAEKDMKVVKEFIFEFRNENEKHGTFNLPISTFHLDSIMDVIVVKNKSGVKKLVSADKDGVLKLWS